MTSITRIRLAHSLILVGIAALLVIATTIPDVPLVVRGVLVVGGVIIAAGWWLLRSSLAINQPESPEFELARQRSELDTLRETLIADLSARDARVLQREQELNARSLRFHEFLEYPDADSTEPQRAETAVVLSEQDRKVRVLLEREAGRFYEKVRANAYSLDGQINLPAVRDDAVGLMKQVASIYKPDSEQPLLETSFDQLARAASRICLQTLVLLEQLPVQVQHYSVATLFSYFRRAVVGYGVYQKASPWLTYLSRGLYAGRLVATTNPVSLGTWWLASEAGRYGARKVMENVVDRQAVAILHELVTVLGVEIAGIYGTGFRRRDPAWVLGTEVVELVHSFPESGESLKNGLKLVTSLPLRSEYDRIYLYRCLASHTSANTKLSDPAQLTREERESIAKQLESFFAAHIHGTSDAAVKRWREGLEQRFDLKLNLDQSSRTARPLERQELESAAMALVGFAGSVVLLPPERSAELAGLRTIQAIGESPETSLHQLTAALIRATRFEPPDLEPSSLVTDGFLADLATLCAASEQPDDSVEQLVIETFSYFRHQPGEARKALERAWTQRATALWPEDARDSLRPGCARAFFEVRAPNDSLAFAYEGVGAQSEAGVVALDDVVLMGLRNVTGRGHRLVAVMLDPTVQIVWECPVPVRVERSRGLLIDDAQIRQGRWLVPSVDGRSISAAADLVIAGSVRRGRYASSFRELLEFTGATDTAAP